MKTEAEWHAWRKQGIGSSDAPAVLGVCPYRTRLAVWLDKTGRAEKQKEKEAFSWGHRLEDDIAEAYTHRTGRKFKAIQFNCEHFSEPHIRATVDGLTDCNRIVEFKSLGVRHALEFTAKDGDWESLPRNWIVQVHHQMFVLDADFADVAVFYPLELRLYTVPRSDRLIDALCDHHAEFWQCVVENVPPRTLDPRDHERIDLAYPRAADYAVDLPAELMEAIDLFESSACKESRVKILDYMGDAATGICPDGRLLRRTVKNRKAYTVAESTKIELSVERGNG